MTESSPLLIDEIRNRTREDIFSLLAGLGFGRSTAFWVDAELAEALIFQGPVPESDAYHRQLGWIAEYIGLGVASG